MTDEARELDNLRCRIDAVEEIASVTRAWKRFAIGLSGFLILGMMAAYCGGEVRGSGSHAKPAQSTCR
jgi:hypothetical protein